MATKTQKIKVGVFLVLTTGLFVAGVLLMAGFRHAKEISYTVIFDGSVLGLNEGGLVQYNGVPVGRVSSIRVGEDHRAHVGILIDPQNILLREGVQARLEIFSLAAGTMCVAFSGSDPDGNLLDPKVPIIGEKSLIESASKSVGDIIDAFLQLMNRLSLAFEGLEEGDLAAIVERVATILERVDQSLVGVEEGDVADLIVDVKGIVAEVRKGIEGLEPGELALVVEDIKAITASLRDGFEGMEKGELAATFEGVRGVVDQIQTSLEGIESGGLAEAVREMRHLVEQGELFLEDTSAQVDVTRRALLHDADNMQHEVAGTLTELNEAIQAIRNVATQVEEDPASVIRGKGTPKRRRRDK